MSSYFVVRNRDGYHKVKDQTLTLEEIIHRYTYGNNLSVFRDHYKWFAIDKITTEVLYDSRSKKDVNG